MLCNSAASPVIRAIGPDPASLPAHPALQPLGFINKQTDTARFVAELQSWHFGTLFSEAEAFGISNRECLRLGVPVLAHAVGGIASTLPDAGCGQLFAPHPGAAEVTTWILARLTPYEGYLAWRAALAPRWREFTWAAAAEQLALILNHRADATSSALRSAQDLGHPASRALGGLRALAFLRCSSGWGRYQLQAVGLVAQAGRLIPWIDGLQLRLLTSSQLSQACLYYGIPDWPRAVLALPAAW